MWDLVGNPEDRFSHNEAHLYKDTPDLSLVAYADIVGSLDGYRAGVLFRLDSYAGCGIHFVERSLYIFSLCLFNNINK